MFMNRLYYETDFQNTNQEIIDDTSNDKGSI